MVGGTSKEDLLNMRHFLIDTDTASDDAVALIMALNYKDVQVEAITTVSGNVHVDQASQNALYTVELCGRDVPVFQGAERPLVRPLRTAEIVHGNDGMGDIGLPLRGRSVVPGHAVTAMLEIIRRFAGEITLVTLGPLTNVALALAQDPSIAKKVKECIVMGGIGRGPGNITPVAEYNIWVDPEAAKMVFEAGFPLTMVGWDVAHAYATLTPAEAESIHRVGTTLAAFCVDIQKTLHEFSVTKMGMAGFDLPDPLAMAVALDQTVVTKRQSHFVAVETTSELCRGQTVVDHFGVTEQPPNADVVFEVSRPQFLQMLFDAVAGRDG